MPHLYLVRHAQPDFAGNYDSVTALGLQQSAWLGQHFSAGSVRFARVISGNLVRQKDTLDSILRQVRNPPDPIVDPRFNEYDAASVLGAFAHEDDRALRVAGDRRAYFKVVRAALVAWSQQDPATAAGETWHAFGERVSAGVDAACEHLEASARVLIVTSGGVIGRIVAATLGAGPEAAIHLNLQTRNTGVTELIRGRSGARLVSFNAVPHLEQPGRGHAVTHS